MSAHVLLNLLNEFGKKIRCKVFPLLIRHRFSVIQSTNARFFYHMTLKSRFISDIFTKMSSGWLGRAMVLGSFQCQGVLLLWHMIGQGPAVLAACAGRVTIFYIFFISSILSSFSNASSVGRRLDILKYCGLGRYNPAVVVSYYRRRAP